MSNPDGLKFSTFLTGEAADLICLEACIRTMGSNSFKQRNDARLIKRLLKVRRLNCVYDLMRDCRNCTLQRNVKMAMSLNKGMLFWAVILWGLTIG